MRRFLSALGIIGALFVFSADASAQEAAREAAAESAKPAPDGDGPYEIRFHSPMARGDRFKMTLDMKIHSKSRMSKGLEMQFGGGEEDLDLLFKADVRVIKVNETGEPTWAAVKVTEAKKTAEGKTEALSVEGADLGVSFQNDKMNYQRKDGTEIPPEEQGLLGMIFQSPTNRNPDDYLAPKNPVRVGESWEADKALMAEALSDKSAGFGFPIKPENLAATLKLQGIETWNGLPCYRVIQDTRITDVELPRFTGEFFIEIHEDQLIPVDPSVKKSSMAQDFHQRIKGKVVDEKANYVDFLSESEITAKVAIE